MLKQIAFTVRNAHSFGSRYGAICRAVTLATPSSIGANHTEQQAGDSLVCLDDC